MFDDKSYENDPMEADTKETNGEPINKENDIIPGNTDYFAKNAETEGRTDEALKTDEIPQAREDLKTDEIPQAEELPPRREYSYYNINDKGDNNQYGGQYSGQYGGQYGQTKTEEKQKRKRNSKSGSTSLIKKFGIVMGFAACAGLVAGLVFFGVNAIGNSIIGNNTEKVDTVNISDADREEMEINNILWDSENAGEPEEAGKTADASDTVQKNSKTEDFESVADVTRECMPSVVTIATISVLEMQSFYGGSQTYQSQGAGTGVIVGQNETELLIATNNHVVNNAKSLSVGFIDETSVEAQVKGTDPENDLAVIAVKLEDISEETLQQIKIAAIGSSDSLELGEQVVAIGNALGYGQSVTSGFVSAKGRELKLTDGEYTIDSTDLIQTDAAINAGNSGGALLNMKGQLVGINEAKKSKTSSNSASVEGMGYAIPIDKAFPILEELMTIETRTPVSEEEQGYLGITCAEVTEDIANNYNMPIGVAVTEVIEGGPCYAAGIIKGDVITAIGEYSVESFDQLKEELTYHRAGEQIAVTIMRSNQGVYQEETVMVTLDSYDILQQYYEKTSAEQ